MSTPVGRPSKPTTRSTSKKTPVAAAAATEDRETGGSPILQLTRKRKGSENNPDNEPLPKRMADNQVLEAIRGIHKSMTAMETQMKSCSTKRDLDSLVGEIKEVKDSVNRNSDRIDELFKRVDEQKLERKIGQLVKSKVTKGRSEGPVDSRIGLEAEQELQFLGSEKNNQNMACQSGQGGP